MSTEESVKEVSTEEVPVSSKSEDFQRFISSMNHGTRQDRGKLHRDPPLLEADYSHLLAMTTSLIACFHYPQGIALDLPKRAIVDQLWRQESHCLDVSNALLGNLGITAREEVLGKEFGVLFPPNERNFLLFKSWVGQDLQTNELYSPYVDNQGKKRIIFTSIYYQTQGETISHIWIISRDRTRQWNAKNSTEYAEQHYRGLVERPGVFLIRHHKKNKFTYVSDHFADCFGIAQEELQEAPQLFEMLIHPNDV
ncbi:MAG: hypothetical protein KDD62_15480, partial [Bdellovibrionales bacterium]|nr:hypothetical protein [Bdellovibrionales bacterium]